MHAFVVSRVWQALGMTLTGAEGVIHLALAPEHYAEAAYIGLLFLLNTLLCCFTAFGIWRDATWGWALGMLVSGGALLLYVLARTSGLPDFYETVWLPPAGILAVVVESLFLAVAAYRFVEAKV